MRETHCFDTDLGKLADKQMQAAAPANAWTNLAQIISPRSLSSSS
ncbi:hypothetical protein C4J85_4828 [Pseudomonas sp. R4-34-07]|nr:hypothetical protein C4J85_4828 [Pseudomonas sp. R4-34-07]